MTSSDLRVLIVDDERINLRLLSELLRNEAQITLANNGPDAISKAREFMPDIILLDVVMPGMDGFAVIAQLKNCPETCAIPVIFVTGLDDAMSEERGFELGACDYIQKPFHAAVVRARVKLHLQLARQRSALEAMASIDPLTTIANRRKYQEVFNKEWLACQREQQELTVAMIDVDFFKSYNDHYGHVAGDEALTKIATALARQMRRPRDFVARYGGEEFVVISVANDLNSEQNILQRCIQAVRDLQLPHQKSPLQHISISIGGVSCIPGVTMLMDEVVQQADQMLYQTKQSGRNDLMWRKLDKTITMQAQALSVP